MFWVVFVVAGLGTALGAFGNPGLFDRLDSGEIVVDGENQQGRDILTEAGGSGFSTYSLLVQGVDLSDPTVAQAGADAVAALARDRPRRVGGQPLRGARGPDQ